MKQSMKVLSNYFHTLSDTKMVTQSWSSVSIANQKKEKNTFNLITLRVLGNSKLGAFLQGALPERNSCLAAVRLTESNQAAIQNIVTTVEPSTSKQVQVPVPDNIIENNINMEEQVPKPVICDDNEQWDLNEVQNIVNNIKKNLSEIPKHDFARNKLRKISDTENKKKIMELANKALNIIPLARKSKVEISDINRLIYAAA
ncbi:hypothetical protein FQA39_LY02491 [Lamprigera yunnana]|nr:hypothetical protein FQA39_LY02491 [Lamprigera yunnana]